jgi:hypothetical protein
MTDDGVFQVLRQIVIDLAFEADSDCIRDEDRSPPFVKPSLVHDHPKHQELLAAVEQDSVLGRLFSDNNMEGDGNQEFDPGTLAARLINAALWGSAFKASITRKTVLEGLGSLLHSIRQAIDEGRVDVHEYVGFGMELPQDVTIDTPYGVLRSLKDTDALLFDGLSKSQVLGKRGCVLETRASQMLKFRAGRPDIEIYSSGLEDRRWRKVALGMLLVCDPEAARNTLPWFYVQRRFFGFGGGTSAISNFSKGSEIETRQIDLLKIRLNQIDKCKLSEIVINRTLGMVARRRSEDIDAIVDGVIVWEALFSTKNSQEISYRVSMNMACVLEDAAENRVELQKEINGLYGTRSGVVHGSIHLPPSEASRIRERVQSLTIKAVTRMIEVYPHLLDAKATDFVKFILLGK